MTYDFIIVGAGSAGAVLASRLTENPDCSVLLIEAGPDYPGIDFLPDEIKYGFGSQIGGSTLRDISGHSFDLINSPHSWQYIATATPSALPMPLPRGKIMGGSSAINYAAFLRGIPEDFESWASYGNDLWSFDKVLPYFVKSESDLGFDEEYHGKHGPMPVRHADSSLWNPIQHGFYNACIRSGYQDCPDHNAPYAEGVGPPTFNRVNGVRYSTALTYIEPARNRENLTIRTNCLVHRVIFSGARAVGISVESDGNISYEYASEVILSAGVIGSPHILMLSGIGPANKLEPLGIRVVSDLPGLGENLRDHPKTMVSWEANHDVSSLPLTREGGPWLRYTASGSSLRNDMAMGFGTYPMRELDGSQLSAPDASLPLIIENTIGMMLAASAGKIELVSDDPHIQPKLDYNYLSDPFDLERMREAIRISISLSEDSELRPWIGSILQPTSTDLVNDDSLNTWLLRNTWSYSHSCGTCKMGPDNDSMASVDQTGIVKGIKGLRVVDASIMPDCVRAFLHATVIMIGEKLADVIKQ